MSLKNNFYYLEPNDLEIVLDALETLYNQIKSDEKPATRIAYSPEDVEMILEALKNSDKYKY